MQLRLALTRSCKHAPHQPQDWTTPIHSNKNERCDNTKLDKGKAQRIKDKDGFSPNQIGVISSLL